MIRFVLSVLLSILVTFVADADERSVFRSMKCDGDYQYHLQGVCTNLKDAVYWSFTTSLVKTDRDGRVLKNVSVANHHGDLCFHDGKLYVAVNLGRFNDPAGNADSWVYVYDAKTLTLNLKYETQEVFYGAGGIGVMDSDFYVVGGLPDGIQENYVYQYDSKFRFQEKYIVKSGWTHLGIQTAAFHDGNWWFGCYGSPAILLKVNSAFENSKRYKFNASLGVVGVADDRLLVAKGPRTKDKRCLGALHLVRPDVHQGLVFLPETTAAFNQPHVTPAGDWHEDRFRSGATSSRRTTEHKTTLTSTFDGVGAVTRPGGHDVTAYAAPNLVVWNHGS